MNKNQKITLIVMLLIMAAILIYPPTERYIGNYREGMGRDLIFSIGDHRIDYGSLLAQLSVVILVGGALVIIFSLKK